MPRYLDLRDRLLANSTPVHRGHVIDGEPSECWLWIGNTDHHGYGRLTVRQGGRQLKRRAHRVAAEAFLGIEFKPDETWEHHCRQTGCIHPNHGEPIPNAENAARMQSFWRNYRAAEAGQTSMEI